MRRSYGLNPAFTGGLFYSPPDAPAGGPPALETPAVETPAVETPATETPADEPPVVQPPAEPAVEPPAVPAVEPAVEPGQAPEKYELTLPDGGALDQSDLEAFAEVARAKGLTNEQAQAVLNDHAASLTAQSAKFLSELTAHPEIGGEQLAVTQQRANAVLDRFLPADSAEGQQLRAGLQKSGYGNFAPLVLLLARVGRAMGEDRPLTGGGNNTGRRSAAEVMFGDAVGVAK